MFAAVPLFLIVSFVASFAFTPLVYAKEVPPFDEWLSTFKQEAAKNNISKATLDTAFVGVEPIPRIIELDRKQPEFTLTLDQYLERVISKNRIKKGREKFENNRKLLQRIESKYKVPARFITAFWGIETGYGRMTGGFNVIAALTTLAYDGRRSRFFTKQLIDALTIIDQGHVSVDKMTGSWAGAMGQTQFMPSTFRAYAQDGDGDGKINIWQSKADAFASAANYLSKVGWKNDQTWGREVLLPKGFDHSVVKLKTKKTLAQWQTLGVRRLFGKDLPTRDLLARIVQPDGPGSRAFIAYPANYNAILNWNRSDKFAIAVGTLADAIVR